VRRLDARPRPAAAPLHFAALHRQNDIVAAGVTFDDLEMRAKRAVEHARELIGVGAGAGAADRQLLDKQILELGDAGFPHCDADAYLVVGAADPIEFLRIEGVALSDQERIESNAAPDRADRGTVARHDAKKVIGETKAAGAFEVFRHQCRIARDMRAEMPADHPRVEIIGAADAVADIKVDGAALVKTFGILRRGANNRGDDADESNQRSAKNGSNVLGHGPPGIAPRTKFALRIEFMLADLPMRQ